MGSQVTCVITDHADRITGLGGPGWTQDAATVIGELEEGRRYYVRVGAAQVNVVVIESGARHYLRTDPDESAENNLLSLPSCP